MVNARQSFDHLIELRAKDRASEGPSMAVLAADEWDEEICEPP